MEYSITPRLAEETKTMSRCAGEFLVRGNKGRIEHVKQITEDWKTMAERLGDSRLLMKLREHRPKNSADALLSNS